MARAFEAAKIGEVAFPGLLVAGAVAGGNLLTRALDAKAGRITTLRQFNTWYHFLAMGGAAYCVATDRWTDTAAVVMIADAVPLSDRLLTPLIEQAVGLKMATAGPVRAREALPAAQGRALLQASQGKGVGYRWAAPVVTPHLS